MGVIVRQKVQGKGNPWWVFISHNGGRQSKLVGDKKAATSVASELREKIKLGEFKIETEEKKPIPTFKEYSDTWMATTVPATCKASTVEDYRDLLRLHVLPALGDIRIDLITRGKVKDFLLGKINEEYAKSTMNHMKNVISGVLNKAVDDEVIPRNPAHRLGKLAEVKDPTEIADPLEKEELKLLLDTVQTHYPDHYPLFLLLARTGLRIGEALALQWGDIDFAGRFITVRRSIVRGRISTPKNSKTRRVDMSKQLTETLQAHMTASKIKGFALGLGALPEYVFTNELGGVIDTHNWRNRVFKKVLKKAGLREIRIHDLRHTYATLRISKGDNITDVSNQLGHYSVKLTLDVYNRWIPGKKKEEVDGLDDSQQHLSAPQLHPEPLESEKALKEVALSA